MFISLQAYKAGLYGPKVVWILMGYYAPEFWKTNSQETDCNEEDLAKAVEGSFFIRNSIVIFDEKRGLANLTCKKCKMNIIKFKNYTNE